ncbi:type IV secretion system DNA-binding domain-containing protein [Candidatus Azambacteria bacterium]|nr:type IV secretion system DNA-binding domain-containing protein [Candidatus Azambacteria bacterium]MBI3684863.1 type IV secretion system DNA-binding domain-containing protein [Candidatus Azambacteria bacterium]
MDVSLQLFLFLTVVMAAAVVFVFVFLAKLQRKQEVNYALNMVLLLVSVPLHKVKEASPEEIRKLIGVMEQFYSSIARVEAGWLRGMFQGVSALGFEIVLPAIGEEIHFYLAIPRKYAETAEKQITGFLNEAKVERVNDYNIFNAVGAAAGSYVLQSKSFFLPVKTYQHLEVDPLNFITNAMSKLEFHGEGCAVQVLVKPNKSWQDAAQKIVWEMKNGKSFHDAYRHVNKSVVETLFELFHQQPVKKEGAKMHEDTLKERMRAVDEQTVKAVSDKASRVGFDVNIRLIASALTETRAAAILSGLESAFSQFENPPMNGFFVKRATGKGFRRLWYDFAFRNFNQSQRMILNSEELTSVFHFPTPYLETKKIKSLKSRVAPLPPGMPAAGLVLGKNVYRGEEKEVRISKEDRRRHLYIVGQTGTGKSVSLQNMIGQDIDNGEGVCLIDPHGDVAESVLARVPKHRADDVIVFNPADLERPMGLNMLEYDPAHPEQKTFIINEMIGIFDKLYDLKSTGGPMFEQYVRYALLLVMDDPESGSTLLEVPRVFSDAVFRKMKLAKVQNPVVKNFWEKEAEKAGGEAALANITPYITSKFNTFIANEFVRPIIAQQKSSINFREAMDGKKILLVNLAKGKIGEINSSLLGLIVVGKLLMAAFSRADLSEEQRTDFYLYIDEFQNFATDSISTILSEARKYRLSLTMAHQFIAQLKEPIKNAVFGNVGSMLAFRTGADDAKFLAGQFAPSFGENDIINLDNLNAYARLLVNNQTVKPFNLAVSLPKEGNAEVARILKELSRLKYGKDRRQVELEIQERFRAVTK